MAAISEYGCLCTHNEVKKITGTFVIAIVVIDDLFLLVHTIHLIASILINK